MAIFFKGNGTNEKDPTCIFIVDKLAEDIHSTFFLSENDISLPAPGLPRSSLFSEYYQKHHPEEFNLPKIDILDNHGNLFGKNFKPVNTSDDLILNINLFTKKGNYQTIFNKLCFLYFY